MGDARFSRRAHHSSGDLVYEAGGTGADVAVGHDGGRTWTQQRSGLDRCYGWVCAAEPNIWCVSVSPGAMKTHSESNAQAAISSTGEGWQRLASGLPQPLNHTPYALPTDPEAQGEVYAGLSSGEVGHSADHGESWRQLPFNLKAIHRNLIAL